MGAWDGGSSRAWRKLRTRVLARDGWVCQLQIEGVCTGVATHAHHTQGRDVTGDDPAYIVAACRACNLTIGKPTRYDPAPKQVTKW